MNGDTARPTDRDAGPTDRDAGPTILVLNVGSSSLKFALYRRDGADERLRGTVDRIGHDDTRMKVAVRAEVRRAPEAAAPIDRTVSVPDPRTTVGTGLPANAGRTTADTAPPAEAEVMTVGKPLPAHDRSEVLDQPLPKGDLLAAVDAAIAWLEQDGRLATVVAIGHRVVHGMDRAEPARVGAALLAELRTLAPLDPDHMPAELDAIERLARRWPALPQVACFDTAFHRTLPRVAQLLPIPRRYDAAGIRRYGFHGLSYAYLVDALRRSAGDAAAEGRVVLAHLGSGASLAAVHGGRSVDTTMGFTPAGGLPMGTRSGDLDPGIAAHLARTEQRSADSFDAMANHASGLLGVSETSADMRELLRREATDPRAAEAVALFCYSVKKGIGAYAAALGGLDTLVFSGGIGERAGAVRSRACEGLGFLGIALDAARNAAHAAVISTDASRVTVRVVATDEASVIARSVAQLLDLDEASKESL